jgi:hypothetical protein
MNAFQRKLRWLIVTGSAVSFLSGWGLLAHAGKPVTATTNTSTNTNLVQSPAVVIPSQLPAIDFKSLEANKGVSNSGLQALPSIPAITFNPSVRTRTS